MNIIIMTAATGGGHTRAANALKAYINARDPEAKVDVMDAIEECSALLNSLVVKGYKAAVTLTPHFFGLLYRSSDKSSPLNDLMNLVFSQCSKRLLPIFERMQPDVVISCHAFTAGIVSFMKTKMHYEVPLISIITDFIPHRSYVNDGVSAYITASQEGKDLLTDTYNIPPGNVFFYGHPVYDRFYEENGKPREEVLSSLGLSPERLTVLVMAGSFGVTDILKIYEKLVNINVDYQLIVITGKNRKLYNAFEKMLGNENEFETLDDAEQLREVPDDSVVRRLFDGDEPEKKRAVYRRSTANRKPTKLFYFVDNVEDYMHASDLIITKPGGLTTSESIASALPMAIFQAYPGQEKQNADLLIEHGIAVMLEKGDRVTEQVGELLRHPEKLREMRESCRSYVRKNSCGNIFALATELTEKSKAAKDAQSQAEANAESGGDAQRIRSPDKPHTSILHPFIE